MRNIPSIENAGGQERLKHQSVRPWPLADEQSSPFWEAAARQKLVVPKCAECGHWQWPPAARCEQCDSADIVWTEQSGRATVYSYIVDHRNMVPGFSGAYVVAQVVPIEVEDDSVRLNTNLPGCGVDEVHIGMEVEVIYEEVHSGIWIPQFVALAASA
jgi:uncharacterized OB-fold protein